MSEVEQYQGASVAEYGGAHVRQPIVAEVQLRQGALESGQGVVGDLFKDVVGDVESTDGRQSEPLELRETIERQVQRRHYVHLDQSGLSTSLNSTQLNSINQSINQSVNQTVNLKQV